MSTVLYEHPLNERIRNYLKLEQLFVQVEDCLQYKIEVSHQVFFTALFAIIDTLERNDIRGDLIKDLERLEQNLVTWSKDPKVDDNLLADNLQLAIKLICQLKSPSPPWYQLKDDKFLSGLKQRFAMQGASCSFDLPQLKFWLNQESETQTEDISQWLTQLEQISDSLNLNSVSSFSNNVVPVLTPDNENCTFIILPSYSSHTPIFDSLHIELNFNTPVC